MTYFDKFGVEFSEDLKTLINCPSNFKGEYIVPESVSEINAYAFSHCEGLTFITFPDNLLTIGENAFESCSSLKSLNIPNSVTTIGDFAFRNCISIKSLILGTGITAIGICVFEDCRSLCEVVFPDNVTWIDLCAFSRCTSLTSIRIHKNIKNISVRAFGSCSALESIVVESGNVKYDSRLNCNAIIETATNRLITGCKNTIIPKSVVCIRDYAFSNCCANIRIPDSVTEIGPSSFFNVPKIMYDGYAEGSPWGEKNHIRRFVVSNNKKSYL